MKVELRIQAQCYENYNLTGEGEPDFRPKGSQVFKCRVNADTMLLVGHEGLIKVCENLLKQHSNGAVCFTYLYHEIIFNDPIEISAPEFMEAVVKQLD